MASPAGARETIGAVGRPLTLIVLGAMFLYEYSGGYAVSQTWPLIIILLGLILVFQSLTAPTGSTPRLLPEPRRKSLFGPILLIGIGAALLAKNLAPNILLRAWFAAYWPWILIAWGGFRLVEVLVHRGIGRPSPRGLGFGAVVSVLLLAAAGTAARHDTERSFDLGIEARGFGIFEPSVELAVDHSSAIEPGTTVVLDNLRGTIRVTGVEGPRLRIHGSAELWGRGDDDAPAPLIEIEHRGTEAWVKTSEATQIDSRDIRYDVEIGLPAHAGLRSNSARAHLVVEDVAKAVEIRAGRGKIALRRIGGPVRVDAGRARHIEAERLASSFSLEGNASSLDLQSVAGDVDIRGELFGTVRLAAVEGSARVRTRYGELEAGAIPGQVEIKVRSVSGSGFDGGVRLQSDRWRRVRLEKLRGKTEIRGRRMDVELSVGEEFDEIRAEVDKGDIRLQLPRKARFTVDARTERGRVRNFLGPTVRTARQGSSATLAGGPGDGPRIQLQTGRGTIVIEPLGTGPGVEWDEDEENETIRGTRIVLEELRECLPRAIRQWVASLALPAVR